MNFRIYIYIRMHIESEFSGLVVLFFIYHTKIGHLIAHLAHYSSHCGLFQFSANAVALCIFVSNNVIKASIIWIYIEREIQLMNAALKIKQHRWITIELNWMSPNTDIKTNERINESTDEKQMHKLLNWFLNL